MRGLDLGRGAVRAEEGGAARAQGDSRARVCWKIYCNLFAKVTGSGDLVSGDNRPCNETAAGSGVRGVACRYVDTSQVGTGVILNCSTAVLCCRRSAAYSPSWGTTPQGC